jgi:hypothetical protein
MRRCPRLLRLLIRLAYTLLILLVDAVRFLLLCLRPSPALAAENLFLRKQLALYPGAPRQTQTSHQHYPDGLDLAQPLPADLQALIRRMARENPSWGEEGMANELLLKLGLRVSPRTVRKYLPKRLDRGRGGHVPSQRWRTFVRNQAQAIMACDFCVVVTATFRLLYVFVVMEHATRRILHTNVTAHPTA